MPWLRRAGVVLWLLAAASGASPGARAPGDELPDGPGKAILQASCTTCHDLGEVTKLRGYYTAAQWRDVVETMVEYGASVQEDEVEVLVEYLFTQLGKRN